MNLSTEEWRLVVQSLNNTAKGYNDAAILSAATGLSERITAHFTQEADAATMLSVKIRRLAHID